MSKVAITGHTGALGRELAKLYPDYIGFSRSNGYDICTPKPIIDASKDISIFFNNAHCGFCQVDLLYALYEEWKDTDCTIVNISSVSPETSIHRPHKYAIEKLALDAASHQLDSNSQCRIMLVKPGLFESDRSINIPGEKHHPRYIAHQIKLHLLCTNSNIIII